MKKLIFAFGIAGTLFSGYLSGTKLLVHKCALNETCPIFLGYPACYYGFVMFLTIAILSGLMVWKKIGEKAALNALSVVSLLGIVFAGYFSSSEMPLLLKNGFGSYAFGLPTCMLGLIFFILVFILSFFARANKEPVAV